MAEILLNIPSLSRRKENKKLFIWLLALLSVSGVIDLLALSYVGLIYDILLIYVVFTYNIKYFGWIWFRAIISLFVLIIVILLNKANQNSPTSLPGAILVMGILIPTVLISIKLEKKLSSGYSVRKDFYIDSQGNESTQIIHEFAE